MDDDRRALADTPKPNRTIAGYVRDMAKELGHNVIYDDTAAATPLDNPAGYDLGTCSQKHQRMMAYQAQRIDDLIARVARLEAILEDWSAGK